MTEGRELPERKFGQRETRTNSGERDAVQTVTLCYEVQDPCYAVERGKMFMALLIIHEVEEIYRSVSA